VFVGWNGLLVFFGLGLLAIIALVLVAKLF
jgi:hypothetical protein